MPRKANGRKKMPRRRRARRLRGANRGNTASGFIRQQREWSSGVSLAKPQIRKQIGVMDQSGWQRVTSDEQVFTLGGELISVTFQEELMDTVDIDIAFDFAATITTVQGSQVSEFDGSINLISQFPALVLPHLSRGHMVPGVGVTIVQVVALRFGLVTVDGGVYELQPGMGLIGSFASNTALLRGGLFIVRYRLFKRYDYLPFSWVPEALLTLANYTTQSPLCEWELRWQLEVPRQVAWDRQATGLLPMPNAYTFSFVPTYPGVFRLFSTLFSLGITIAYAVLFDPNEAVDLKRPLLGTVASRRRAALTVADVSSMQFYATQPCRVYIRLEDASGDLVEYAAFRDTIQQISLIVGDPPSIVLSNGVGFRTRAEMNAYAASRPERQKMVDVHEERVARHAEARDAMKRAQADQPVIV